MKTSATVVLSATLLLLLTVVALGGPKADRIFGVEDSTGAWSTRIPGEEQTPGIATGAIRVVKLMTGTPPGVTLAFWCDSSSSIGGRAEGKSGHASLVGEFTGRNGEAVALDVQTTDGDTAVVKIGKDEFSNAKNALFLIRTDGESPKVKKLKFDRKKFPAVTDVEAVTKFASETTEIRGFWSAPMTAPTGKETSDPEESAK